MLQINMKMAKIVVQNVMLVLLAVTPYQHRPVGSQKYWLLMDLHFIMSKHSFAYMLVAPYNLMVFHANCIITTELDEALNNE